MDWSAIIEGIVTFGTTGGVLYLIVEKLFERKRNNVETKTVEISNGNEVADLYNKIDEIVERKTAPIKSELTEVKGQLEEIKSHWCCYREDCNNRLLYKKSIIERIADESAKVSCKAK